MYAISLIKKKLSKGGRANELLSIFLKITGMEGKSSFLGADNSQDDYIVSNGQVYSSGECLGSGSQGRVRVLNSTTSNSRLAAKILNDRMSYNRGKIEVEAFERVYDNLGPIFIADYQQVEFDYHTSTNPKNKYKFSIIPFIRGRKLREYIQGEIQRKRYDELELIANLGEFCWNMNNIGVTHRDITPSNTFVVNQYGGIFFIDYGSALIENINGELRATWYEGVSHDVAALLFIIFISRQKHMGNNMKPLNIEELFKAIQVERWIHDSRLNDSRAHEFIDKVMNHCYFLQNRYKKFYTLLFDPKSVENAKRNY